MKQAEHEAAIADYQQYLRFQRGLGDDNEPAVEAKIHELRSKLSS